MSRLYDSIVSNEIKMKVRACWKSHSRVLSAAVSPGTYKLGSRLISEGQTEAQAALQVGDLIGELSVEQGMTAHRVNLRYICKLPV